ncbi:hypothetical protein KI387_042931, partial [Taxus chinensis]
MEEESWTAGRGVTTAVAGTENGETGLATVEPDRGGTELGEEGRPGYLRRQHLCSNKISPWCKGTTR